MGPLENKVSQDYKKPVLSLPATKLANSQANRVTRKFKNESRQ